MEDVDSVTPQSYQAVFERGRHGIGNVAETGARQPNFRADDCVRIVVGIRVLAGGALSGSTERHPIASPPPEPIGSALNYEADVTRARRLMPIVQEGFAASLTEAATRFAISQPAIGTILVGIAAPHQFENALAAVEKGPLPPAALDRLSTLLQTFSGEER